MEPSSETALDEVVAMRVLGSLDCVVVRALPVDRLNPGVLAELSVDAQMLLGLSAGPITVRLLLAAARLPTSHVLAAYRQLENRELLRVVRGSAARVALGREPVMAAEYRWGQALLTRLGLPLDTSGR